MNKYTARALNEQAAVYGRRVIVVSSTWGIARFTFNDLEDEAFATVSRIVRANGKQRIEYFSGGRISVLSAEGNGQRGQSADLVFIDWDAETRHPGLAQEMWPCVQASPHGEVIRA